METATTLSTVVTADLMNQVLSTIMSVLPVCMTASVSYIALKKGIAFVKSTLAKA